MDTDLIVFSSEPYPFKKRDLIEFKGKFPQLNFKAIKADGQLCSWHGNMTIEALFELNKYQQGKKCKILNEFDT